MTDQWRGHVRKIAIIVVAVLVVVTFLAGSGHNIAGWRNYKARFTAGRNV